MADQESSLVEQVIEHCKEQRFTGVLRIRAQEGEAELWFLSGIADEARFGVSAGDEAMDRLLRATEPKFELDARLPNPKGGFKKGYPLEGELGELRPVDLFHFCEKHALTCSLKIEGKGAKVHAQYRIGELLELDTDREGEQAVGDMLEWNEGTYAFELPPVELPEAAAAHTTQAKKLPDVSLQEFLGVSALVPSQRPAALEAAEQKRQTEAVIKQRIIEVAGRPKAATDSTRAQTEAKRREAEDARRKADEEAKRRAEAEESKRRAEAEARAQREAEAEAKLRAEAEAEAEAKRQADEEAERRRAEAEEKRAEAEAETEAEAEPEAAAAPAPQETEPEDAVVAPPSKPVKAKKKKKKAAAPKQAERRPEPEAAGGTSWGTIVVVLLLVAALGYFFWTSRG